MVFGLSARPFPAGLLSLDVKLFQPLRFRGAQTLHNLLHGRFLSQFVCSHSVGEGDPRDLGPIGLLAARFHTRLELIRNGDVYRGHGVALSCASSDALGKVCAKSLTRQVDCAKPWGRFCLQSRKMTK